jgi:hypothetical protein
MKQGGNAVDAGVGVAVCLGVTGSFFSGAGGLVFVGEIRGTLGGEGKGPRDDCVGRRGVWVRVLGSLVSVLDSWIRELTLVFLFSLFSLRFVDLACFAGFWTLDSLGSCFDWILDLFYLGTSHRQFLGLL